MAQNIGAGKVNRGCHTLEMRTNGTWHDIPNTTHLREMREEGKGGLKGYLTIWEKLDPKPTEHKHLSYIHTLTS